MMSIMQDLDAHYVLRGFMIPKKYLFFSILNLLVVLYSPRG